MVDIFISYSRTDQALVRRLAEAVKSEGYSVWWDDELPPHLSYGDVITAKIGEAKAAIVVWSEEAATSEWVRAEADVARNQKKLIQTSIDGRMPPMPFNQIQFAAIGDWHGEADHPGWMKVKASLVALCGPRAPAAAPPATAPPPAPAPVSAKGARPSALVPVLVGALLLLLLAVAYLLMFRGGEPSAPAPAPANQAAPAPEPAKPEPAEAARVAKPEPEAPAAAPATPRPKAQAPSRAATPEPEPAAAPPARRTDSAPVNPRAVRRYCMGPGRGTAECRELRARYGR